MQILSFVNQYKLHLDCHFLNGTTFYMIIDYCANGDLLKAITDKKVAREHFEEDEIWKYFIQICLGLETVHYNGFIHRDLHLQNVLLDENNDIKIADFGISRYLGTSKPQGAHTARSPRTWDGESQTKESDIWAVGCILYYLCSLEHPFGDNLSKNKVKYEPHRPIDSRYSTEMRNFVDWCLQKKRRERPTVNDILTNEFIVNKTLSLGMAIPETSVMTSAVYKNLYNKERERNEQLEREISILRNRSNRGNPSDFERELFEYQNENKTLLEKIKSLTAEIARLNRIINENSRNFKGLEEAKN